MSAHRLIDLPVRNLAHLFSPLGLPLLDKGDNPAPTTSILVRGGPGVGKTTLGVSLAHAVAQRGQGLVLYLTTEIDPTELRYKAELLGLPEGAVVSWEGRHNGQAGGFVAQHLALTESADPETTKEQRQGALDAMWSMVEAYEAERAEGQHQVPVRAVLIDAFVLPERGTSDAGQRADALRFLQSLEGRGITPVLIEESGEGASDMLSFLVDLVFELRFADDPDTGTLVRQLRCTKSRYAVVHPGPHDYGLDFGRPALWPDLLGLENVPRVPKDLLPALLLPTADAQSFDLLRDGLIVLNLYDQAGKVDIREVLQKTPGVQVASVSCGAIYRIYFPSGPAAMCPASEGPYSPAWLLHRAAADGRINTVLVDSFDVLLRRKRYQASALHVLTSLREAGVLVVLGGRQRQLDMLLSMADLVPGPGGQTSSNLRHRFAAHRHCTGAFLLAELSKVDTPAPNSNEDLELSQQMLIAFVQAIELSDRGDGQAALSLLQKISPKAGGTATTFLQAHRACLLSLYGLRDQARNVLVSLSSIDTAARAARSWALFQIGEEGRAAQQVVEALTTEPVHPLTKLLWAGLCAIYASNEAAVLDLEQALSSRLEGFAIPLLLRARAGRSQWAQHDELANQIASQRDISWLGARMRADSRLATEDRALLREARDLLMPLSDSEHVPMLQQAEVCHNLALACDGLGDRPAAIDWSRKAIAKNPLLDVAQGLIVSIVGTGAQK